MDELEGKTEPIKEPSRTKIFVRALLVLYGLSLAAALIVIVKGRPEKKADARGETKRAVSRFSKSILPGVSGKEFVAVVEISGPIYAGDGRRWSRGLDYWRERIEEMGERDEVKAIVLLINSPGGSVGAVQEIHAAIERVRKETGKPFVAHLGDVAASGGYYLAAACDKIVAHPGSLIGSIGVIFSNTNVEGLMEKVGVKSKAIKSGKMKDIGSMSRPMTDEERALLQGLIDNAYGQFLGAVAKGRKLPESEVRPHADGRIFTGEQALGIKLVDQLGDSHEAVLLAASLGGIKGKPEVLGEGESLTDILDMLEMRASALFSPQRALFGELGVSSYRGLEYRWGN